MAEKPLKDESASLRQHSVFHGYLAIMDMFLFGLSVVMLCAELSRHDMEDDGADARTCNIGN